MFSGIVEEVGKIVAVSNTADGCRFKISSSPAFLQADNVKTGDSISVNGACHTVITLVSNCFEIESTHQTLMVTKLGQLKVGDLVNLERALKVGDRLGGHLVTGHVDGLACVKGIKQEGFSSLITLVADVSLSNYFIDKGSVTVDGVSLTVVSVLKTSSENKFTFTVALIPHTMKVTTLKALKVGDQVNIEVDLIAKYVAQWLAPIVLPNVNKTQINLQILKEHGYT